MNFKFINPLDAMLTAYYRGADFYYDPDGDYDGNAENIDPTNIKQIKDVQVDLEVKQITISFTDGNSTSIGYEDLAWIDVDDLSLSVVNDMEDKRIAVNLKRQKKKSRRV